jgi:hypothetical protein
MYQGIAFDTHVRIDAMSTSIKALLLEILLKIGSVFVCALPARYRRWWPVKNDADFRGAAMVSGLLEFLLGAPGVLLPMPTVIGVPAALFFAEGAVRFLAAVGPGQVLPILPIQIVAWIQTARESKQMSLLLGPLVPDTVERGEGKAWHLRVLSCRAKSHWNSHMTIRFESEFYQMFQEDISTGPRKFVYLLRKNPATRLVVVVYDYDPKDVMRPDIPPRRWKPDTSVPSIPEESS